MIGEEAYHIQGHLKQSQSEQNERISCISARL